MSPRVLNRREQNFGGIYVGRPSKWGNPFVAGRDGTREEVIQKYREYLLGNQLLLAQLPTLKGKNLICWCAPEPCHADVLLEMANQELKS